MEKRLTPRWFILNITGLLFAVYSAYNVFLIYKDGDSMKEEGLFISAVVAALFAVLALFSWTSGIWNISFFVFRKNALTVALLLLFVLKLRMMPKVIPNINFSKISTILYGGAYFMTLAGFLILFVYYALIIKILPLYPKASVILPVLTIILFLGSLVMELVLFFKYGVGLEASKLRIAVIRPVFYLSFIGLSAYFLFPMELME